MSWKTAAIFLGGLSSGMAYVIACGDKEVDLIDSASADPGDQETEGDTAPPPNNQSGSGRAVVEIHLDANGAICQNQFQTLPPDAKWCDCPAGFSWVGWKSYRPISLEEIWDENDNKGSYAAVCLEN